MPDEIYLIITSLSAVAYLFFISKLLGKKQISQLDFIDYVIGISLGSIAAEMASDTAETPIYYYLISMTIFFLFDLFISYFGRKGTLLKRFFKGKPLTIVYEGKINYKQLKQSKLDINDFILLCRQQGYFSVGDIAYAIFENNGQLSILPKGTKRPTVLQDLGLKESASLPADVVIDGRISYSALSQIQKTEAWLYNALKINNKKQLKLILFAYIDADNNEIVVHYKNKDQIARYKCIT